MESLAGALDELPDNERRVIELRFGLDDGQEKTVAAIARELGVTKEQTNRLENEALRAPAPPWTSCATPRSRGRARIGSAPR